MNKTLVLASLGTVAAARLVAQADTEVSMAPVVVYSPQVANQAPVGTFVMPVSALRYDPRVDVQARNLAEGQADVSIRGGTFENTGFKLGALSLYDPQTGHYLAEVPVAPMLLSAPEVLTGADNALGGFNATVGSVSYGWRPISTQGFVSLALGEHNSNSQEFYQGYARSFGAGDVKLGADVSFARSESDGPIRYGDHKFERTNARLQLVSKLGQTDLVGAYQEKFFGWPNMYTPFNVYETEFLQTALVLLNHRKNFGGGNFLQAGAFWRSNEDDYEYNRLVPGQFNPYQHTTKLHGYSLEARHDFGAERFALNVSGQMMFDKIESTSLVFGPHSSRSYSKLSVVPETWWDFSGDRLSLKAGASYDDTNRGESEVSPLAEIAYTSKCETSVVKTYLSFARSSQVATYTASKSNPGAGLFRGNPNLGRSVSDNLELGTQASFGAWKFSGAVFARRDDNLVDWTYRQGVTARSANAVDIDTYGFEASATRSWKRVDLVLGYTTLSKDEDYGSALVDASFYAMNYPRHRLTAAFVARLRAGLELRLDNEARMQADNFLRRSDGNDYFLSSLGLAWRPEAVRGLTLSGQVDNLWDSDFEEVPAVPASPRQASLTLAYSW